MNNKNRWTKYVRFILFAAILGLAALMVWLAFGDMLMRLFGLLKSGDTDAIEDFIEHEDAWKGIGAVIILSVLQVISIVFPGFAIQIASGVIYGWWRSFLMCYFGFLLGNLLVFSITRRMGDHIMGIVNIDKNNKNSWITEKMKSTKPGFVVAFINLLPVLPNGIIPYIAAGSSIEFSHYLGAIAVSSWVQILFNCIAGHFLIHGQYLFMALALSVQIAILIFATVKRKWIMSIIPGSNETDIPEKSKCSDMGKQNCGEKL